MEFSLTLQHAHSTGSAGFFGRENHKVAFESFIGSGEDVRGILLGNCFDKAVHESEVTAAVSGKDTAVVSDVGIDFLDCIVEEVVDVDNGSFVFDHSFGTEDAGAASAVSGESGHGHGAGGAILKLEIDDLIVHNVVIAGIDAASVGTLFEGFLK